MLYYVGQVLVIGKPGDERMTSRVWAVSDQVRMGRQQIWSGSRSLEPPPWKAPRQWLLEALGQLLEQ